MGTLCIPPTDCLAGAGQAFFTARRGVRAAPAPRQPMQQRGRQAPATAASPAPAAVQSRPERGQRSRRRPSPAAEARALPHKRAMENVVILKRGDPIPAALMAAAPPAAELSAARGVDQRGRPDTGEEKAEASGPHGGADAEKAEAAPAAHQTVVPLAKEAAAKQLAATAGYSGPSFAVVAPEPRALPIPVLFLKPRARGRGHDVRAMAPAAAAA